MSTPDLSGKAVGPDEDIAAYFGVVVGVVTQAKESGAVTMQEIYDYLSPRFAPGGLPFPEQDPGPELSE